MTASLFMRASTWSSRPATPTMPGLVAPRGSQDAPRLWWQQLAADQVEVGQCEPAEGARQVLGHTAVADLRKPPQPLDHVERVLAPGAGSRPPRFVRPPGRGQRLVRGGAPSIHPIAHALGFKGLPIRFLPVRLVAVEHTLL